LTLPSLNNRPGAEPSGPRLPKLHSSIFISATPHVVWDVLVDPVYAPKLYHDVLFMEVKPRGKAVKGQKRKAVAMAGRTRIVIYGQVAEADPPERFTLKQMPGGLFETYTEDFRLSETKLGTEVRAYFDYHISLDYLKGALNIALLENGIADSLGAFLKNLKEIAELKPLPERKAAR
jgi:hypothetical protein